MAGSPSRRTHTTVYNRLQQVDDSRYVDLWNYNKEADLTAVIVRHQLGG
jgi:hypothetical protein